MAMTPQETAFARLYATGKVPRNEAYSTIYDVANLSKSALNKRASLLASRPDIVAAVKVITDGVTSATVKAAAYTIDKAMEEAEEARQLAHRTGQSSAASAAVKLKSQLAGHVLDRKEVSTKDPLAGATIDELARLRDEVTRRILAAREASALTERTNMVHEHPQKAAA